MLTPEMGTETVQPGADGSTVIQRVQTDRNELSPRTIHGDVETRGGSEPVTLVNAYTVGRTHNFFTQEKVGPDTGVERFQAHYAVRGGHLTGVDEEFTGVRIRLRHLDTWANLGASDLPAVRLAGGGQLSLDQQLTFPAWLRVDQLAGSRLLEIDRTVVTPLTTLLSLAVGTSCSPVQVELQTGGDTQWMSLHASWLQPPADQPRAMHEMLLPLAVLGLPRVAAWLDRVEALGPLPPVVAAFTGGALPPVETAVLELATVAEGLARRLWPQWNRLPQEASELARKSALRAVADQGDEVAAAVRSALAQLHEPSYGQRLLRLAERVGDAVPGVIGNQRNEDGQPNRWKREVTNARIDLAHRLDRGWLDEATTDRYLAVTTSLRWLLTGVLLLETGLQPETLANQLKNHQPYQLFLQQARHWLPSVFG